MGMHVRIKDFKLKKIKNKKKKKKKLKLNGSMKPTRPFRTNTPKDVLFIIRDWNVKVGSQEIPQVTGKFGHGL